MDNRIKELAEKILNKGYQELPPREQRILRRIAEKHSISKDINKEYGEQSTFGDRLADKVASFGGSWTFIILFGIVLLVWIVMNGWLLTGRAAFDPYPFIFLNFVLSMIAAVQAPVIMMSQNRQAEKDRLAAAHDYEVNLKAELEIMSLHEKVDDLRMRALEDRFTEVLRKLDALAAGKEERKP